MSDIVFELYLKIILIIFIVVAVSFSSCNLLKYIKNLSAIICVVFLINKFFVALPLVENNLVFHGHASRTSLIYEVHFLVVASAFSIISSGRSQLLACLIFLSYFLSTYARTELVLAVILLIHIILSTKSWALRSFITFIIFFFGLYSYETIVAEREVFFADDIRINLIENFFQQSFPYFPDIEKYASTDLPVHNIMLGSIEKYGIIFGGIFSALFLLRCFSVIYTAPLLFFALLILYQNFSFMLYPVHYLPLMLSTPALIKIKIYGQ